MYQAYEYASNAVSLVKFLLEIVLRNPKTLKNPKNEWNQHFIGRVLSEFNIPLCDIFNADIQY